MRKILLLIFTLLLVFGTLSCGNTTEDTTDGVTDNPTEVPTNNPTQNPTQGGEPTDPTPTPEEIVVDSNITSKLQYVDIEIEETYNISSLLSEFSGMLVSFEDSSLVSYSNGVLTGLKNGVTKMVLKHNNKEQVCRLEVHAKGALSSTFTFDEYRLTGKNIVAFGDSVTDFVTNNAYSYYERFAQIFNMNAVKNYGIGGTTAHYGFVGSTLYGEYFYNGDWITDGAGRKVVDGVQRVKNAYTAGELSNIDYVFIAYTHNDQHYQPALYHENDKNYNVNSFESCYSFYGSYYHMINTLKIANPNVRIIVMDPTYSQYDIANIAKNTRYDANNNPYTYYYGKEYDYSDYRRVIKEVAKDTNVKYVSSWNYLKDYYDFNILNWSGTRKYYNDPVHLSAVGQQVLAEYLANGMSNWYLSGEFTSGNKDAQWNLSKVNSNEVKVNITITKNELGKSFVVSGDKVLNGDNLSAQASYISVTSDKKIKLTELGEYVLKVNLTSGKITITKTKEPAMYFVTNDSANGVQKRLATYDASTGLYTFTATFVQWTSLQINFNGDFLKANETTFNGKFATSYPDTTSDKLYYETFDSTFFCPTKGGCKYTFTYDPKTDTLNISTGEAEVVKGFSVKVAQNATYTISESNGVYTVTMVGSGQFCGIQLYMDGELLSTTSLKVSGSAYYASYYALAETSSQVGIYYQAVDGVSIPGWFSIKPGSFVFVYDSNQNTLVINNK